MWKRKQKNCKSKDDDYSKTTCLPATTVPMHILTHEDCGSTHEADTGSR